MIDAASGRNTSVRGEQCRIAADRRAARAAANAAIKATIPSVIERLGLRKAATIAGASVRSARSWAAGENVPRMRSFLALAAADADLRALAVSIMAGRP